MRRPLSRFTSVLLSASLLGGGALAQTGSGPNRSAQPNPAQMCAPRDGQPRTGEQQTCPQTSRTQQPSQSQKRQPQTQTNPNHTGQVQPQRQSAQAPQARRADVGRVDVYLDGREVLDNVTRERAARLRVGPGEHRIVVVPHGQPLTGALTSRTFRVQKATTVQLSLGDSFSISLH